MDDLTTRMINKYLESGKLLSDLLENDGPSDIPKFNKEMKKVINYYQTIKEDVTLSKNVLSEALKKGSKKLKISVAIQCLSLNILEEEAISVLENLSLEKSIYIGFNARTTLELWRKQGYFPAYVEEKK